MASATDIPWVRIYAPRPDPLPGGGGGQRQRSISVPLGEGEPQRGVELGLLDRLGGVDALRTDDRAFADEGALPDALGVTDHRQPLLESLVARVEVVAAGKRRRGRAQKLVVETVDRAGRVTEHAVDALAELPELVDLLIGLVVLTCAERRLLLADDPRLDLLQLVH